MPSVPQNKKRAKLLGFLVAVVLVASSSIAIYVFHTRTQPDCDSKVRMLRTWITRLGKNLLEQECSGLWLRDEGQHLVGVESGNSLNMPTTKACPPAIEISSNGVDVIGHASSPIDVAAGIETTSSIESTVATALDKHTEYLRTRQQPVEFEGRLILNVHRDAKWSEIVRVINTAEKHKYNKVYFLFRSENASDAGKSIPSSIKMKLQKETPTKGEEKLEYLLSQLRDSLSSCPQAKKEFFRGRINATLSESIYIRSNRLPDAIADCECSVDFENLREILWNILFVDPLVVVETTIASSDKLNTETIALSKETHWSVAYKNVITIRSTFPDKSLHFTFIETK